MSGSCSSPVDPAVQNACRRSTGCIRIRLFEPGIIDHSVLFHAPPAARQLLCDWMNGAGGLCGLFDFVLKGQMNEAVKHVEVGTGRIG